MDMSQLIVAGIVVVSFVMFVLEIFSVDVVSLLVILMLMGTGIVAPDEALVGFANPALLTIACLFIISEGLLRTGAVTFIGRKIIDISGGKFSRILLLSMIVVGVFSIFANNTPIVAIFIPIILGVASENNISPSKLLLPISYASIFGGTCSLVGTSTNILVSDISDKLGYGQLRMFEFSQLGLIFFVVGIVYMVFIGRRMLPDYPGISTYTMLDQQKDYVTEIEVQEDSPLIGKKLVNTDLLQKYNIKIFEIIRSEEIIWPPLENVVIRKGDILLFKGDINEIIALKEDQGVRMLPKLNEAELQFTRKSARLAELLITAGSEYIDRTINDIKFKARYDISVLALQRRGVHLRSKITDIRLKAGDILLVFGSEQAIEKITDLEEFVLMEGVHKAVINRKKAPMAIGITLFVVVMLTLQVLPIPFVALMAASMMVFSGCLTLKGAYKSLNLPILILIAGMISLGHAVGKTGLDELVASHLVDWVKPYGPVVVLGAMYLFTSLMTGLLSNNAVAILLTPIVVSTAVNMNLNPKPFIIAVTFGASASFATPIGYQTNTMVYGPGNYKYMDFIKIGLPLNIIFMIIATLMIPVFWPFY